MGAAAIAADGVDPVSVPNHNLESFRLVKNSRSNPRVPFARLLKAGKVIYYRGGKGPVQIPPLLFIQRNDIIHTEQTEIPGADFLVIIAGQGERKLRNHR